MSKFEDYFNKEFIELKDKQKDIKELLTSENMYLISGDFYGIQKFIFDGLTTKNAAKVLRAKSAFVQLFTSVISKYICKKLEIDEKNILSTNAGKFEIERMEILAPYGSYHLDEFKNKTYKELDFSSGVVNKPEKRYVLYYDGKNKVIIEPNEGIIKAIKSIAPRKVFTD